MKFILYSIILLVVITTFIIFASVVLGDNKGLKNKIKNKLIIDSRKIYKADKNDIKNIYLFLEDIFGNDLLLPKNITFIEKDDCFESKDLYYINNNNTNKNYITLYFNPINNNTFISKYSLFNKYGSFKIKNVDPDIPDITHLSTESTELNFNLSDIINSDYSEDEIDTDIDTTESFNLNA